MPTIIAALAIVFTLTGCGGSTCSAVGWSNTVVVEVDDGVAVSTVEVCDERGCSNAPAPDGLTGFSSPQRTGDGWVFELPDMSTPDELIVRALDANCTVLREVTVAPEWKRIGGSEQCGGPGEARVRLEL
jgi:hypothetical protein